MTIISLWRFFCTAFLVFVFLGISRICWCEEAKMPIIVNGDTVEFIAEEKKVVAEGNVVIEYEDAKLTCERVAVFNDTKQALAEGNVTLTYPRIGDDGKEVLTVIKGKRASYNFDTKEGTLLDTDMESSPFYGKSSSVEKIGENELRITRGYFTTCDLPEPHYRLRARQISLFPNDKIVARNVTFLVGKVPLAYIPKYVQRLDDKRPRVTVIPGYSKKEGAFLLSAWRYYFIEGQQGRFHLDYREKRDFAWGITHKYTVAPLGTGLLKTYYMNERIPQSSHLWDPDRNSIERERFKVQWYHKKEIDDRTTAILEYHKFSDPDFLKDYFFREYDKDNEPDTYFLLTRSFPTYNLSFRADKRVNRFYSASVERLPEMKADVFEQRLFETPLYISDTTTFSNLRKRYPDSAESTIETKRLDTFNKVSLPSKIAFVSVKPYAGLRQTYFSENAIKDRDVMRGIFYTGIDFSTKFFRQFNVQSNPFGIMIDRLRHVVTPSIAYSYIHEPTIPSSRLLNFDEIDTIVRENKVIFSVENKLQTKRNNASYDLARLIVSSDYLFKQDPHGSYFNTITSDLELTPVGWLRFESDTAFDVRGRNFKTVNADFIVQSQEKDKWSAGFGERYERKVNRQLQMQGSYRLTPKWKVSAYERFYPAFSRLQEQEYVITRDLHCWEMSVSYNVTRGEGNEIWVAFRLKAFPEFGFEFNQSYHAPKAGSQSERGY